MIVCADMSLFGKPHHNYKGLQFDESNKQYLIDFKEFYDKDICWFRTKHNKLMKVSAMHPIHVKRLVEKLGTKTTISRYPLIYYRYLKEVLKVAG